MGENFDKCMIAVLGWEGGFSNDPSDRGGATNHGITRATLAAWRGHAVTAEDVGALSQDEAKDIYRANYWRAARCNALPAGLDLIIFDLAVNSGPGRAVRMLQEAVGAEIDGAAGPATMRAVGEMQVGEAIRTVSRLRRVFYRTLADRDPTQEKFIRGWVNRLDDITARALAMAQEQSASAG